MSLFQYFQSFHSDPYIFVSEITFFGKQVHPCQWTSSAHQNCMVLDNIILELSLIGSKQELSRISKCSFSDLSLGMITYKLIGDSHIIRV